MYTGSFAYNVNCYGTWLDNAIDAVQTSFTINAKDPFGNDDEVIEHPMVWVQGTGFDDPFLVESLDQTITM